METHCQIGTPLTTLSPLGHLRMPCNPLDGNSSGPSASNVGSPREPWTPSEGRESLWKLSDPLEMPLETHCGPWKPLGPIGSEAVASAWKCREPLEGSWKPSAVLGQSRKPMLTFPDFALSWKPFGSLASEALGNPRKPLEAFGRTWQPLEGYARAPPALALMCRPRSQSKTRCNGSQPRKL